MATYIHNTTCQKGTCIKNPLTGIFRFGGKLLPKSGKMIE
jgi:hypothetical protein